MGGQRLQTLGRLHVPDADGLVEGSGNNEIRLRIEVAAEDVIGMSLQGLHAFSGGQLPDLERLIVGGGDEQTGVAGPGDVGDSEPMTRNGFLEFAVVSPPNLYQFVGRRRSEPFTVGREFNRRNRLSVAGERKFQRVIWFGRGGAPRVGSRSAAAGRRHCGRSM